MKHVFIAFYLFLPHMLMAQQAVVATGGNAIGSSGTISLTVGQIFNQGVHSNEGSLFEGVQQPYEISVATSLIETDFINLVFNAFPNPTRDILTLSVEGSPFDKTDIKYQLFDLAGRRISSGMVESNQTSINMGDFPIGTYLLKVIQGSLEMKSFKIIKN